MSRRTDSINAVVVLSAGALLAACGGVGGGGGGDSVTTSSNPVTISTSNAPDVAAASYKTTACLEGGGGGATGFLTGAVAQTNPGGIDLVDVLISQVKEVPQLASAEATATLTGAVIAGSVKPVVDLAPFR